MKAQIRVTGAVQGVGYRPFVAELASEYHLSGEVRNAGGIVEILLEGEKDVIEAFADRLKVSSPAGSIVCSVYTQIIDEYEPESQNGFSGFHIVNSLKSDGLSVLPVFPPDIGICDECLAEMRDAKDRRYRYPLISCTSCGPRYSILNSLPYDRENITMDKYVMCPDCAREYLSGRRRHAQTISCHECGPQYFYKKSDSEELSGEAAIKSAIKTIEEGGIVGLKGVGGYQLVCSPYNYGSVSRLRQLKGRETKPFAIMFSDVNEIRKYCKINEAEEEFLTSAARPIVLLDKKELPAGIREFSENVCQGSKQIGAFLPNSGIHSILTKALGPLIVTSGNVSGNPMIISDDEFFGNFEILVDGIMYHDRKILRPLDDSVLQIVTDNAGNATPRFIRRSRGYVPLPLFLDKEMGDNTLYLSFGGDLKNTFCIGYKDRLIQSQYFGDLDELKVRRLKKNEFIEAAAIFGTSLLNIDNVKIISDLHPGYSSTGDAKECFDSLYSMGIVAKKSAFPGKELKSVQHHHAHIGSVMAENSLSECLGVAFDGTGFGLDGNIWGSEFLICKGADFDRAIYFRYVKITGQDEAMKNASLSATAYLNEAGIDTPVCGESEDMLIRAALKAGINTHMNCGMGRLFDAVACILGIGDYNSYEGECAVRLQNAAEDYIDYCDRQNINKTLDTYKLMLTDGEFDSRELIRDIFAKRNTRSKGELSYIFHVTIADCVLKALIKMREETGINIAALSGGVFANRLLLTMCISRLRAEGFVVYYNKFFPTNDGGISAGQIYLESLRE